MRKCACLCKQSESANKLNTLLLRDSSPKRLRRCLPSVRQSKVSKLEAVLNRAHIARQSDRQRSECVWLIRRGVEQTAIGQASYQ